MPLYCCLYQACPITFPTAIALYIHLITTSKNSFPSHSADYPFENKAYNIKNYIRHFSEYINLVENPLDIEATLTGDFHASSQLVEAQVKFFEWQNRYLAAGERDLENMSWRQYFQAGKKSESMNRRNNLVPIKDAVQTGDSSDTPQCYCPTRRTGFPPRTMLLHGSWGTGKCWCTICSRLFGSEESFEKHMTSAHVTSTKCHNKACREKFKNAVEQYQSLKLQDHSQTDYHSDQLAGPEASVWCLSGKLNLKVKPDATICNQKFCCFGDMIEHLEIGKCNSGINQKHINRWVFEHDLYRIITKEVKPKTIGVTAPALEISQISEPETISIGEALSPTWSIIDTDHDSDITLDFDLECEDDGDTDDDGEIIVTPTSSCGWEVERDYFRIRSPSSEDSSSSSNRLLTAEDSEIFQPLLSSRLVHDDCDSDSDGAASDMSSLSLSFGGDGTTKHRETGLRFYFPEFPEDWEEAKYNIQDRQSFSSLSSMVCHLERRMDTAGIGLLECFLRYFEYLVRRGMGTFELEDRYE